MKFAVHGTFEEYARKFGDRSTGLPERGARIFEDIRLNICTTKVSSTTSSYPTWCWTRIGAQICDFGSARSATRPEGAVQRGLLLMGAPGYMAPEVLGAATGEAGFALRSMWSAGVCLFSLFHRSELLFKGRNAYELQESLEVGHLRFAQVESRPYGSDARCSAEKRAGDRRPETRGRTLGGGQRRRPGATGRRRRLRITSRPKRHMAATAAEGRKAHHAAAEATSRPPRRSLPSTTRCCAARRRGGTYGSTHVVIPSGGRWCRRSYCRGASGPGSVCTAGPRRVRDGRARVEAGDTATTVVKEVEQQDQYHAPGLHGRPCGQPLPRVHANPGCGVQLFVVTVVSKTPQLACPGAVRCALWVDDEAPTAGIPPTAEDYWLSASISSVVMGYDS